jgi:N-acetylmuramoyl-L-alanine amidase
LLHVTGFGAQEGILEATGARSFNWQAISGQLYFTISVMMVLGLIMRSIQLYRLKTKGRPEQREGFLLIRTDDPRAPFSFMNMLFLPTHMREDNPEGRSILMHELAHIRQHHTLDKLAMELILAACWLNPFNWLIKKELWLQHEFLADKYAIADGNSEAFARMLLYSVSNASNRSVLSPFFQSPIKRRLSMLSRPDGSGYGFWRSVLSIPVLLTAILLLAVNAKTSTAFPSPKKVIVVLDAAHGGNDAGVKSAYGHQEKDFTLALCKKLTALSKDYNIEIIPTRTEDMSASLQDRVQKSNSNNADIFLSMHINQSSAVRDNTYQIGVNPKSGQYSKTMLLASSIAAKLRAQKLPVEVVDLSMSYVLRENSRPALLIECGNLDDADNIALLKDEARSETLCRNILSGIVDYNARLSTK